MNNAENALTTEYVPTIYYMQALTFIHVFKIKLAYLLIYCIESVVSYLSATQTENDEPNLMSDSTTVLF